MEIEFYISESTIKPLEVDVNSSPHGVYVRRNIKEIEKNDGTDDEKIKVYRYQEAFLTKSEYEQYSREILVGQIDGESNSEEYERYKKKLDTGVLYTNGFKYKPKYIDDYKKIMSDIKTAVDLIKDMGGEAKEILSQKFAIYDETGKSENMVMMSGIEVINLYFFLYAKKEQYFAEYKLEKELGK